MKTKLFFLILLLYSGWLYATPRTPQYALEIAQVFIDSHFAIKISINQLKLTNSKDAITRTAAVYPAYYVINVKDNNGFVIVSGDDCAREILAYSDKGNLDVDNLPSNVKYWLDFYAKEITSADLTTKVTRNASEQSGNDLVVEPLLGSIEWDQGAPYNLFCPEDRGELTVTGCAATSMAMVMKYHKYPKQGTGSYRYITQTLKKSLSADFGNTTYQWDLMLPQYNSNATDEQKSAVAKLMEHCGIAQDMDYNVGAKGGSGAGIFKQYDAFINYFGYNPNMYYEGRDYNNDGRWKELIKTELRAGRPILYSGQSSEGGHSFVLDGCNADDMYHFNWGWSGYANGYYSLSSLDPGTGGTGSGSGAFNDLQYILLMVQPEATENVVSRFTVNEGVNVDKLHYGRDETITVTFKELQNTATIMNGIIGLALYKEGTFITYLTSPSRVPDNMQIGAYWPTINIEGSIPPSVPTGSYQLHLASQKDGESIPSRAHSMKGINSFYNVEVTNSGIELSVPESGIQLTQKAPVVLDGEAIANKNITFTIEVENNGVPYEDELAIFISQNIPLSIVTARIKQYVEIPESGPTTLTISGNPQLPAGEYYAIGSYRDGNKWKQFTGKDLKLIFTIKDVGTGIRETEKIEKLKAIPTPTGLSIISNNQTDDIEIFNAQGIKVVSLKAGTISVELPQRGIYIVRQGIETIKVLNSLQQLSH